MLNRDVTGSDLLAQRTLSMVRKIDPKRNKEEQERRWEATMVFEVRNGGDLDQVGVSDKMDGLAVG